MTRSAETKERTTTPKGGNLRDTGGRMFIGHNALAFGMKRVAPEVSLGVGFLAVQLPDLLWPVLLLLGVEKVEPVVGETPFLNLDFVSYPYSHSLLGMVVLGLLLAVVWYLACGARTVRGFLVVFGLVVSHWVLDWVTHRPDLPLSFSGGEYGLGMWFSPVLTMVLELGLFFGLLSVYLRSTRAVGRSWGLWCLVGLLVLIYLANAFSPPPPSWQAVAWAGLLSWLFPVWAWLVDRKRVRA